MSKALQVSLPSLPRTQVSGSPRNSVLRLAGVRVRTAMDSAKLNSVKFAMPMWMHGQRFGLKRRARFLSWSAARVYFGCPDLPQGVCLELRHYSQSLWLGFLVHGSSHFNGGGPGVTTDTPHRQEGSEDHRNQQPQAGR